MSDQDCTAAGLLGPCLRFPDGLQVSLTDQFAAEAADVKKPLELCLPTERNGTAVINPALHAVRYRARAAAGAPKHQPRTLLLHDQFSDHLMIYGIRAMRGQPKHTAVDDVRLDNQFGPGLVSTIKERVLLVPALKELR